MEVYIRGTGLDLTECFLGLNKAIGEDTGDTGSASDISFHGEEDGNNQEFELKLPSISTLNRMKPEGKNIRFISWDMDGEYERRNPEISPTRIGLVYRGKEINFVAAYEEIKNVPEPDKPTYVEVIGGDDRIDTTNKLSGKFYSYADKAVIARKDNFPDALTASVLAKALNAPILLTDTSKLDKRSGEELKRLGVKEAVIVGKEMAISETTEQEIKKLTGKTMRIGGLDRYETSAKVADNFFTNADKAFLASGQVFADALVAGPVAAGENSPLLLTKKDKLPQPIKENIKRARYSKSLL